MWTCDKCGFTIKAEVVLPVHCRCGVVQESYDCPHRSPPVGQLKRGCTACTVYRCTKYSTICTLTTPSEWGLPVLVDGVATEERVTRETSRQCSLCRAAGEDT